MAGAQFTLENPEAKVDEKLGADKREARSAVDRAEAVAADPTAAVAQTSEGYAARGAVDKNTREAKNLAATTPESVAEQAVGSEKTQATAQVDRIKRDADVEHQGQAVVDDAQAPVRGEVNSAVNTKISAEQTARRTAHRPEDEIDSAESAAKSNKASVESRVARETDAGYQKDRAVNAVKPDAVGEAEAEVAADKSSAERVRSRGASVKSRAESLKDTVDKKTK